MLSLQGGDLLFINENLGIMGVEILISVLSLTAITMMLYMHRLHKKTRRNMLLLTAALLTFMYIYDHGERFEKHGFYNLLVLMLIYVPLNLAISLLYVLFITIPNFAVIFLVAIAIVLCSATIMLRHYMDIFGKGTFDRMHNISGECAWQGNNYPLVDLLPSGTQNFWAGGMHCKPETAFIWASFDNAGILHVNCTSDSIFVDVLPETRHWPLEDKSKWQVFNHRVLDRMVRKRYNGPMQVDSQIHTKAMYIGEIFPKRHNPLPIWAYYRDRGYVTARVETSCEDWTRTYAAKYYKSHSYSVGERSLDYELSAPFCMPEFYPASGNSFGNFKGPFSITARCLYGRHVHEYGFDYIDQLREELRSGLVMNSTDRPYMLMLNLMEGHEGTGEVLRTLDIRLSAFLADMRDSGELEDTALFLLSDHGLHMGLNFAFLNSGQIEHKNPFFAMVLPQWLRTDLGHMAEQGLLANEQRLTTPLETHYTLKTLADWPVYDHGDFEKSLFAPVKAGRTCADANIGASFCMCK
ncbi:hypothetical protein H4217_003370 [Coemansia sp. RSA 1939]|nr:hypothetical protein H4217_003370 [Coemansia sp. RSA 1939]